ncbi:MAG: MJ0042-type zinc finger domain-containing protein [Vicinamibacterales bacterium]
MPPPPCPSCRSTATVTTSPSPNAESYWRCTKCGDVWNVARAQADRFRARHTWR